MTILSARPSSQIEAALSAAQRHLGDTLTAAYLYGSAVTGGLRPHSDVDLLMAVTAPVEEAVRTALTAELLDISSPAGGGRRPLELTIVLIADVVPWRYPPRCELQFGEWLRADIVSGEIPQPRLDPDLAILLTSLREHNTPLLGPASAEIFNAVPKRDVARAIADLLPFVVEGWPGDERNALLTLARMWMTSVTLDILPKDAAATWALERLPAAYRSVLERARAEYATAEKQDWTALHDEVRAAVICLEERIERALQGGTS